MQRGTVLAFLLACCGTAFAADDSLILRPDGLGQLPIGTKYIALEKLLVQKLPPAYRVRSECAVLSTKRMEALGVTMMIENGLVTRFTVEYTPDGPSAVKTAAGIGLGSTEDEVKQAYGERVVVKPNRYDPSWHYLVVDEPDHRQAIIFETNGRKVTSMRAGEYPSVGYTEGCR
jgi:hypothetical protein